MSFVESRKAGLAGEKIIRQIFEDAGASVSSNKCLTEYDLEVTFGDLTFTVEVKTDLKESETGNLAIEYYNPKQGKPSGILATKAELWSVVLKNNTAWLCATTDLKRYFNEVKPLREISSGGDNNASLRLYPSDKILSALFHEIGGASTDYLTTLVHKLLEEK